MSPASMPWVVSDGVTTVVHCHMRRAGDAFTLATPHDNRDLTHLDSRVTGASREEAVTAIRAELSPRLLEHFGARTSITVAVHEGDTAVAWGEAPCR